MARSSRKKKLFLPTIYEEEMRQRQERRLVTRQLAAHSSLPPSRLLFGPLCPSFYPASRSFFPLSLSQHRKAIAFFRLRLLHFFFAASNSVKKGERSKKKERGLKGLKCRLSTDALRAMFGLLRLSSAAIVVVVGTNRRKEGGKERGVILSLSLPV